MRFFKAPEIAILSILIYVSGISNPTSASTKSFTQNTLIAQQPVNVSEILLSLPRPKGSPIKLGTVFSPNSNQQKELNFQIGGKPQPTADFYRQALGSLSYQERSINAVIGDWGFSLVFDLPVGIILTTKDSAKKAVLVIQGTKLSPSTINLNLRFEEI